ncbi:MAG: DUF485 domain-containing protein [Lysobacterales bacterium]
MNNTQAKALMDSAEFKALSRRRHVVAVGLALFNVAVYFVYVLCMGFARDFMAQPVMGGPLNIGLVATIALVILAPVISCYYIWWANRFYDPALKQMLASAPSDLRP